MIKAGKKHFLIISLTIVAIAGSIFALAVGCMSDSRARNTSLPVPAQSEIISAEGQAVDFFTDMEQQNTVDVKPGNWGGTGISFVVEKQAVAIQLDCASINVASKLRARKDGRFTATGLLKRNGPGPIRLDGPKPQQVRLEGKITGKQMKLKITIADTGEVLGDLALERDKAPRLHRCL